MRFEPADPAFRERMHASFKRQEAMRLIGASLTLAEPGIAEVTLLVTAEYKINILAPGRGGLVARAEVLKPGRTLTVARADVYGEDGRHVATMQQTLIMLADTSDTPAPAG